MKSEEYNQYLEVIKEALAITDREKQKKTLLAIKTRLLTDYGLNDKDAKILVKKC